MDERFGSIITAAVTPMHADGSINTDAMRRLARHLVNTGSDSIVVCGTTGESPTVTDAEKITLIKTVVDEVGSSIPVIAGTGTNDTRHTIELTQRACDAGASGVLVVTPYYNKPPRMGLLRHFERVATASSVPVILYNIPARVVTNLEPDLIAELAQVDNIMALKQAHPDPVQTSEIVSLAPDLAIYAGNDDSLLPMLGLGAIGGICVASHIVGLQMKEIVENFRAGDDARAVEIDASLADVYETLSVTTNPIPIKAALNLMGFEAGPVRLPLVDASGVESERIRAMLERHHLLADTTASVSR